MRFPRGGAGGGLFGGDAAAVAVVARITGMRSLPFNAYLLKPPARAETVIGQSSVCQFPGVLPVERRPPGLHVGRGGPAPIRSLVPLYAEPREGVVEVLLIDLVIAGTVGIFQPEDEFSPLGAGEKIIKKSGSDAADMLQSGRGGRVAVSNFHRFYYILRLSY